MNGPDLADFTVQCSVYLKERMDGPDLADYTV